MKIVYEDKNIIAINKPHSLPTTYRNENDKGDCAVDRVIRMRPDLKRVGGHNKREAGLLYRLDNETAGILIFAKNSKTFAKLKTVQDHNRIFKHYLAVCNQEKEKLQKQSPFVKPTKNPLYVTHDETFVVQHMPEQLVCYTDDFKTADTRFKMLDIPIGHSRKSRRRMVAVLGPNYKTKGKPSANSTYFRVLTKEGNGSIIEAVITKGCRHQIRMHLSTIGYPIVGDSLYNKESEENKNLQLFCWKVTIDIS